MACIGAVSRFTVARLLSTRRLPQKRISRVDSRNARAARQRDREVLSAAVEGTRLGFEGLNRKVVSRLRQRLQELARDAPRRHASPQKQGFAPRPRGLLLHGLGAHPYASPRDDSSFRLESRTQSADVCLTRSAADSAEGSGTLSADADARGDAPLEEEQYALACQLLNRGVPAALLPPTRSFLSLPDAGSSENVEATHPPVAMTFLLSPAPELPGCVDEAEEPCKAVLSARLEQLGDSHPDTLDAISLMAAFLAKKGDLGEAEEWSVMALEGKVALFGREHRAALVEMHNRANILRVMGAQPPSFPRCYSFVPSRCVVRSEGWAQR